MKNSWYNECTHETINRPQLYNTKSRIRSLRIDIGSKNEIRYFDAEEKPVLCIRDDGVNHDTSHWRPIHVRWFSHLSVETLWGDSVCCFFFFFFAR